MKTKLRLRPFAFALLAGLAFCLAALPARAQTSWGTALSFDGVDDYVEAYPFNGFPSTAITMELWLRTSTTKIVTLFSYATTNQANQFLFGFQSSDGQLVLVITNQVHIIGPLGPAIRNGQWHHLAAVWQSADGLIEFY